MSTIKKQLLGKEYARIVIEKLELGLEIDIEDDYALRESGQK